MYCILYILVHSTLYECNSILVVYFGSTKMFTKTGTKASFLSLCQHSNLLNESKTVLFSKNSCLYKFLKCTVYTLLTIVTYMIKKIWQLYKGKARLSLASGLLLKADSHIPVLKEQMELSPRGDSCLLLGWLILTG